MGMEETVGLFTLPWSDRKRGGPWLIAQVAWSLHLVMSDGNCLISVIYRMASVFIKSQHCLSLHSWALKIGI